MWEIFYPISVYLGIFVSVLLVLVTVPVLPIRIFAGNRLNRNPGFLGGWTILSVIVVLISLPFVYEFPSGPRSLIRFVGNRYEYRPLGTWEWDHYVNLSEHPVSAEGSVTLLVDGNRLKKITYWGSVRIISLDTYFAHVDRRKPNWADSATNMSVSFTVSHDMRVITTGYFCEFDRSQSAYIGRICYNPTYQGEQQEFETLAESWLNDRLKDEGLAISGMTFGLE